MDKGFGLLAPRQRGLSTRGKNTICTYTSSFLLVPSPSLQFLKHYLVTLDCITKAGSFMTCDGNVTKVDSFMTCVGNNCTGACSFLCNIIVRHRL